MKTQIKRTYNSSSIRITTFKEEGIRPKRRKSPFKPKLKRNIDRLNSKPLTTFNTKEAVNKLYGRIKL